MNIEILKAKCPVCGMENAPTMVETERDAYNGARIKAKYHCCGERRRLFGRKKACGAAYGFELRASLADEMISKLYGGNKNENRTI